MVFTGAQHYKTPAAGLTYSDRGDELRSFYLAPRETYSLKELAALWRVPLDDVTAMFADVLDAAERHGPDADAFRITWAEAVKAATAYHVFRAVEIEQALGADFERVRPGRWRTAPLVLHLPQFILDALTHLDIVPSVESVAARAERLLCETVQAECILQLRARNDQSRTI